MLQLQIFMNCLPLDVRQLLALCHHYHQKGAKLGRDLGPTVNQPCDFYAIMAAQVLIDQYHISGELVILQDQGD